MIKLLVIHPFVLSYKNIFICLLFINFLCIPIRLSSNIGGNRNIFLELKSKLGFDHVVLKIPKSSPEKLTLTLFEIRHLQDNEKTDCREKTSCLKWTKFYARRKLFVNFHTDTDKLNISCTNTETVFTPKIMKMT